MYPFLFPHQRMTALKVSECTLGHAEVDMTWIWFLVPDNHRLAHRSRARAHEAAMTNPTMGLPEPSVSSSLS